MFASWRLIQFSYMPFLIHKHAYAFVSYILHIIQNQTKNIFINYYIFSYRLLRGIFNWLVQMVLYCPTVINFYLNKKMHDKIPRTQIIIYLRSFAWAHMQAMRREIDNKRYGTTQLKSSIATEHKYQWVTILFILNGRWQYMWQYSRIQFVRSNCPLHLISIYIRSNRLPSNHIKWQFFFSLANRKKTIYFCLVFFSSSLNDHTSSKF